ncbi:MAG: hypothetical protein AAF602_05550 [Myxococcota bacterium]
MAKEQDPPRGHAVREALIDAAIERYASGEPFSVRAVAALARVNLGQIHHVFGGKEGLRKAMLHRLAEGLDARLADLPPGFSLDKLVRTLWAASVEDPRFVRVLARQLVEHPDEPVLQSDFPVSRRVERALVEAGIDDARLRIAHFLSAGLGFALFGPWIEKALGLDESELLHVQERLRTIGEA